MASPGRAVVSCLSLSCLKGKSEAMASTSYDRAVQVCELARFQRLHVRQHPVRSLLLFQLDYNESLRR